MKQILETKNMTIGYTSKKKKISIAKAINIQIKKPKLITLIGENGIGKSTLLRTLSKVQPILNGKIIIDNKNINNYTNFELSKKISIVLTEKIPPSNLTVYDLIALGRQTYTNWLGTITKEDRLHVDNAMKLCNIQKLSTKKIDELSDGQYQKMMIARALAQNTLIILLDEPTAHLDINNKIEIFQLLKSLVTNQNKLVIISTHELQSALLISDDLWIMTKNKFICDTKENHIKNGNLNKIINSKLVRFDKEKEQFVFN